MWLKPHGRHQAHLTSMQTCVCHCRIYGLGRSHSLISKMCYACCISQEKPVDVDNAMVELGKD